MIYRDSAIKMFMQEVIHTKPGVFNMKTERFRELLCNNISYALFFYNKDSSLSPENQEKTIRLMKNYISLTEFGNVDELLD